MADFGGSLGDKRKNGWKFNSGIDNPVYCESEGSDSAVIGISYSTGVLPTTGEIKSERESDKSSIVPVDSSVDATPESVEPVTCCGKVRKQARRCKDFFTGTDFLVYSSHFLSAWGDRMWAFGVGLFLIDISPESLQLTASYGLASGITILLLGALVGDWVDNTPRLKAAQLSLVLQNLFVVLCAGVVYAHLTYRDEVVFIWDGWLQKLSYAVIIVLAILSNIFSMARVIAVERDWIVEICGKDRDMLAKMTATLRRIDLATKILAPIATGQIMYFTQMRIGAVFIGGWNLVTVFFEYFLIWKVYNTVPALRKKKDWTKADRERAAEENTEEIPVATAAAADTDDIQESQVDGAEGAEALEKGDNSKKEDIDMEPMDKAANSVDLEIETVPESGEDNKHSDAEENKSNPSCCGKCLRKMFSSFVTLYTGWKTYMHYDVSNAGLGLACLFMTVLGFDNITTGFAYSQGISESILGVFMATGALIGIIGTVVYPVLRRCVGLERTGLFALTAQISCLSMCVISIWMPGSPFEYDYFRKDHTQTNTSAINCTVSPDLAVAVTLNSTSVRGVTVSYVLGSDGTTLTVPAMTVSPELNSTLMSTTQVPVDCPQDPSQGSYVSIALLMAGIITARFGLWTADLTITQLFMERVAEKERGKVNGVQNSLNKLMDMLKFAMVVALPQPQVFGYLILISFGFICIGFILYASFSRRARGHLLPFHKHCAASTEEANHATAA